MPRKNNLDNSLSLVEEFFDRFPIKSFTHAKFIEIFNSNRDKWHISQHKYGNHLLDYLIQIEKLKLTPFSDGSKENKFLYSWKTQDEYSVISGLKYNSYYSFYSAIFLHQLTLQIPKTLYLNSEHTQPTKYNEENFLSQDKIDNAFKNEQRKSSTSYSVNDKKVVLTNGKYTDWLGVINSVNKDQYFFYTDLERTLIDAAIRPVYSGGVFEVLEAYRRAKGKLNTKRMAYYLDDLQYIYPYHQVIGFYLEKAGYDKKTIKYFDQSKVHNFYLTYNIRKKEYSEKWKLYFPKGF